MFPGSRTPGRRNGVITAATPRMTAENPTNSPPRTAKGAVKFDRLEEIVRAARLVAAAHAGAGDNLEHRIEDPLIEEDHQPDRGA